MSDSYLQLPDIGDPKTVFLIDLHCWMHRFFAKMGGKAAHGFLGFVESIIDRYDPSHMAILRDPGGETFRHQLAPGVYKAHRSPPDPTLSERIRWAWELSEDVLGLRVYRRSLYEADDLIAALTKQAKAAGFNVVIVGLDKDLMQLVDNQCIMWDGKAGVVGYAEVVAKFNGLGPHQISDYLAIVGDSADNVPGIHGLGPVGAEVLLKEFGTLDEALAVACSAYAKGHPFFKRDANWKYVELLRTGKTAAQLSQKLVSLAYDAPIDFRPKEIKR